MSYVFGSLAPQEDPIVPPPANPNAPPQFIPHALVDALKSIPRGLLSGQEMFVPQPLTDRERSRLSENRADKLDQAGAASRGFYDDLRSRTHEPETTAGRYAETLASVAGNPLNWVGPGTIPFKAGWNAASGMGSEAAGQAYEGTPWEKAARVVGAWSPMAAERAIALAPKLPSGNVGVFGGKMAVTADHQALNRAEAMAKAGATPEKIWQTTGWGQGTDGKWRFEIPDNTAVLNPRGGTRLGELLDHPALYEAYPKLAGMKVKPIAEEAFALASYTPPFTRFGRGKIEYPSNLSERDAIDSVLHEAQHAVQNKEGFVGGSNRMLELPWNFGLPFRDKAARSKEFEAAGDRYWRNAGEVEARNTAARGNMDAWDRRALPPAETMSVPMVEQTLSPLSQSLGRRIARGALTAGQVIGSGGGMALSGMAFAEALKELLDKRKAANPPPDERIAKPPWTTEDVPAEQQIFGALAPGVR